MSENRVVLRESLSPNFKILQTLGYWPPENTSANKRKIYIVYATTFVTFMFIIFIISEMIMISLSVGDLNKLTDASFLLLTHFAQAFKLYFFTSNNRTIKKLADSLERDMFQPKSSQQEEMLLKSMFQAKATYYVFISMAFATCMLWGIFPFIDSGVPTLQLPIAAYYPFKTDYTPVFQIMFLYQIVATTVNAATNISMDTVASGFMAHIGGQLDLLNDTLVNIKYFATKRYEKYAGIENFVVSEGNELVEDEIQKEMDQLLSDCVEHHKSILDFAKRVGVQFNVSVLCQIVVSSIIICMTMFKITLVSTYSIQFVSMVLYQGCLLVEIALYCWFGNEVILKSQVLPLSAYLSDWTHCTIPFKKKLLTFMIRSNVPIKLYAGNFFTLSVDTLAAILKTSWSYFAVLRRVHD